MDPVHEDDLPGLLAKDLHTYFEVFYDFYRDWLFRFCWHLIGNPDDAEELMQETFMSVFVALQRKKAEVIGQMQLRGYLAIAAIRCNINNIRKNKRHPPMVSLDTAESVVWVEDILDEAFFPQPDSALERKESDQRVYDLLMGLPRKYRVVIWLNHIEGFNKTEVGRILGVSRYLAGKLLDEGMELLKQAASGPEYQESSCIE